MVNEKKKRVRQIIKEEGWERYGLIDDDPSPLLWEKEVEIMYVDMDGEPCRCRAIYHFEPFCGNWFEATNGPAKGNHMGNVFAFKETEKEKKEEK